MRNGGKEMKRQTPRTKRLLGACALCFGLGFAVVGCAPAAVTSIWTNPAVAPRAWGLLGGAGFTSTNVAYTSLAIDRAGTPYVAFEDGAAGAAATVMKLTGGSWVAVGTPGFSPNTEQFDRIAIDSTGTPYVGYMDMSSSKANVMKHTGVGATGWQSVGPADFSTNQITEITFAMGNNDVPFVAYVDASTTKVTVESFTGAWSQVGTSSLFNLNASFVSLAVDSKGFPWVAYSDGGAGGSATVMRYDGSFWNLVGPIAGSASTGPAAWLSLALDAKDVPYLACMDTGHGSLATVKKYVGGLWVDVGTPGFSAAIPSDISLVIGLEGVPYVAYSDGAPGRATVMMFVGVWIPVGTPGFSPGLTQSTSLALDPLGVPYIAFMDGNAGNKATVMAYK
jgi:hypothetical protein